LLTPYRGSKGPGLAARKKKKKGKKETSCADFPS